ncbi:ECF transporter S component [Herbiconiux sp. SYSU D00978]|uniref:ECF transporter S component n=1 Tax=Herbiconiux sp. SYSU D00978 TaxID=2812562 RepID=UPI001A95A9A8|nr:ECF transporter S component [Herbiconiux sp. SYSU D00978]
MTTTAAPTGTRRPASTRWRVVDIVTASVLGVALGLVFILWNAAGTPLRDALGAVVPGLSALLAGIWLLPAVLGALVIRKPGAALYTELLAATVSVLIVPNEWGWWTIEAGLVQGIGAELVFALFLYRRWGLVPALLAGAGAGLAMAVNDLVVWYASSLTPLFGVVYTISSIVTGVVLAGLLGWALVRALARTGALSRFAAGREHGERV